jgi:hypothetical protein
MILSKKSKNAYRKPLKRVFVPKIVEQLLKTKEEELFNKKDMEDIMQIEKPKKKTKKKNNKE